MRPWPRAVRALEPRGHQPAAGMRRRCDARSPAPRSDRPAPLSSSTRRRRRGAARRRLPRPGSATRRAPSAPAARRPPRRPRPRRCRTGRISVAICPGEVRAVCTATAASAPTVADGGRGAHPGGDAARPALGIRGQRRVERAVIGGLVADDVDDRRVARGGRCAGWPGRWPGRGRNAAASRPACRPCGRSRRRRRSPRPRTGPARSACRGCGPARRRNASPTCRDWRSRRSTPLFSSVWTRLSAPFMTWCLRRGGISAKLREAGAGGNLDEDPPRPGSGAVRLGAVVTVRRPAPRSWREIRLRFLAILVCSFYVPRFLCANGPPR